MKTVKKLFAAMLAVIMVMALVAAPAFAAGSDSGTTTTATGSITITPKDNGVHTFTAYQIFAGELSSSGVLSNVVWGSNITDNGAALLAALKDSDKNSYASYFTSCTTAANVAEALNNMLADADISEAEAAEMLIIALESVTLGDGTALTKDTDGKYKASDLGVGYYLVKDEVDKNAVGAKASDMILQVVGNVNIDAKVEIPQVTKEADGNSYGIGDEIEYTLTATVPDYNKPEEGEYEYNLEFTDTMASTLDLVYTYIANANEPTDGIVVKMGDTVVTEKFEIRYENHVLTVKCADISKIDGVSPDSVFTVTYKAKINSNYDGSGAVNNTVTLVTKDYTTTDIIEKVFPINLQVLKVDGENPNKLLKGAEFTLQNERNEYLQVDANGKVNGWVEKADASTLVTDEDGQIKVVGLAAGTYTLTETKAPDTYNLATTPFTLVITAEVNQAGDELETLTISVNDGTATNSQDGNKTVVAIIENNQGAQLPSTGGIGTTVFYVIGGILIVGAVVLLVTRKRMREE